MPATLSSSPIDRMLYGAGLILAGADGLAALLGQFAPPVPSSSLRPLVTLSVVFLIILLCRMVLDRGVQRAVNAANRDMRGDPARKLRFHGPLDPTWGLFGARMGSTALAVTRAGLAACFGLMLLTDGFGRRPGVPLQLAITGLLIVVLLSMLQLRDHYPPAERTALGED